MRPLLPDAREPSTVSSQPIYWWLDALLFKRDCVADTRRVFNTAPKLVTDKGFQLGRLFGFKEIICDDVTLDLTCAFIDPRNSCITKITFDMILVKIAVAAVDL